MNARHSEEADKLRLNEINAIYQELLGQDVIIILDASQLNILGQTFRPVFTGTLTEVNGGSIQLNPVVIKMPNAPNFVFPSPLNLNIENIAVFAPFGRHDRLTLS